MPKSYCENLIFNTADGFLDDTEVKDLLNELRKRAENRSATKAEMTGDLSGRAGRNAEDMDRIANELVNEKQETLTQAKREAYNNILKAHTLKTKYIDRFQNKVRGLYASLDGVQENIKDSRFSTGAIQKVLNDKYFGLLLDKLDRDNLMPYFLDPENSLSLAKALRKEAQESANVAKIGEHVNSIYEGLRKEAFESGAPMRSLDDFGARQTHSVEKMLQSAPTFTERYRLRKTLRKGLSARETNEAMKRMAKEKWIQTISPLLDLRRTFGSMSSKEVTAVLGDIYDAFLSGEHLKAPFTEPREALGFKPKGNLAKKMSAGRELHFKDATSWWKYNEQYGHGSIQENVLATIHGMSNQLGLLKMWGTNPQAMLDKMISYIKQQDPSVGKLKLWHAENIMKELDGSSTIPVSNGLAKAASSFRAYESMAHLGKVMATSFNDLAVRASLLRNDHGVGFFDAWGSAIGDMVKGHAEEDVKIMLKTLGVWSESEFGHQVRYFAAADTPGGKIGKAMMKYFKLAGMTWWDKTHKEGVATMLSRYMALRRGQAFDALPIGEQRAMRIYGLESKEWDLIRHPDNVLNPYGNTKLVAAEAVQQIKPELIRKYLGKPEAAGREIQAVRNDIEERLRTYFIDQVDHALITPSATDRAFVNMGTQPGTPLGELVRFMGQFKYFSIGMTRRVGARIFLGHKGETDPIRGRSVASFMEFLTTATLMGYIGNTVKDLAKGQTPMPPNTLKAWTRALDMGATGIMTQYLFGEYHKYGTSFSGTILGPAAGTTDEVIRTMYKAFANDHPGRALTNFAFNNFPGANLWGVDLAMKVLFLDNLKNKMSPGYKHRLRKRLRETNQKLWY